MSHNPASPRREGVQGWRQFLVAKEQLLMAFDHAKILDEAHIVSTSHGNVAEAIFRDWLASFLPRRYAVTSGYIISTLMESGARMPHYDVIIYDQFESPILWIEKHADLSVSGYSRAIPVEHVRAVIEVKSRLDSGEATKAIKHLDELQPLLIAEDRPLSRFKKYLPNSFFRAVVFFELLKGDEYNQAVLDNLVLSNHFRGRDYIGGLVLRGEGLDLMESGFIRITNSTSSASTTPDLAGYSTVKGRKKKGESLLGGIAVSRDKLVAPGQYAGAYLIWDATSFPRFAFGLVALLNGTYSDNDWPSEYGLSW